MFNVWFSKSEGGFVYDWFEDSGGFDRCVPCGPFVTQDEAIKEAREVYGMEVGINFHAPLHYED